jgi:phosphoglycolate phosphatase-like HAD superfamily hydrolase
MTDKPSYLVDFDGVLCDSRHECMITSHVAYRHVFDGRHEPFAASAIAPAAAERFTRYRYLARTASEFSLLWDLIHAGHAGPPPRFEEEWMQARAAADPARLAAFRDAFYAARHEWMQADLPGWSAMHRFFPEMGAALASWLSQGRAHICSSKDSRAILSLLRHYGIRIDESLVNGCEGGDKIEHFRRLLQEVGGKLAFIDDNLENLRIAHANGIAGYLASWGYTSQALIEAAQREGFAVLTLAAVEGLA